MRSNFHQLFITPKFTAQISISNKLKRAPYRVYPFPVKSFIYQA